MTSRWPPRIAAFLVWALAALSAAYWVLRMVGMSEAPIAAGAIAEPAPAISVADLAKALGPATTTPTATLAGAAQPMVPDPAARMRLLGIVAGRSNGGVALISIDGQVARPYRVGSQIDDSYKLSKVEKRSATLTPMQAQGADFRLELPASAADAAPRPFGAVGAVARQFGQAPANAAIPAQSAVPVPGPQGDTADSAKD